MSLGLTDLRRLASEQLLQYRRNRNYLIETRTNAETARISAERRRALGLAPERSGKKHTARELLQMRRWACAIEHVRALLAKERPVQERFMCRCYGLDTAVPLSEQKRARIVKLAIDFHVAESTAYRWCEGIVDLVLLAAVQSRAIEPFEKDEA